MGSLDLSDCLIYAVCLFGLATVGTRAAIGLRIIDRPSHRSAHVVPTPRAGGIGPSLAFALGIGGLQVAGANLIPASPAMIGAFAAWAVVTLVGFADDICAVPALWRLGVQILAAAAVTALGFTIDALTLPGVGAIPLGPLAVPLTMLWLVGLTNAFNFMDGLDGLAGGTAVIAGIWLGLTALALGASPVFAMAGTLAVGALGFTIFNFPRAQIFMGDVGSQFFGFGFALLGVLLTQETGGRGFVCVPLLFAAFITDTGLTVWRRRRRRERLTEAHREHLFQYLHRAGMPAWRITAMHWAFAMLQGAAGFLLATGRLAVGLPLAIAAAAAIYAYVRDGLNRGRQVPRLPGSSVRTSRP